MILGQITETSERCKLLKKILLGFKPKNIVEIGTWKGLGSTKCILDSINNEQNFYSVESNVEFYNVAKQNLSEFSDKVKLLYGRIIDKKDVLQFVSNKKLSNEQNKWLNEDLNNLDYCENILSLLPSEIDFLFLDGGEFSTYPEWIILKDRIKIVALDDISELKTNQIHYELMNDKNYELLYKTSDGNGLSIFKKI
jgi:hypothetical protein